MNSVQSDHRLREEDPVSGVDRPQASILSSNDKNDKISKSSSIGQVQEDTQPDNKNRLVGPHDYRLVVADMWPGITDSAKVIAPVHGAIYKVIKARNLPNYLGAQIKIPSGMRVENWRRLLKGYHDERICDYIDFGWPISYTGAKPPTPVQENHKSALDYMEHVDAFIEKERAMGAMIGPFAEPPFDRWFQVSPLMTRPKKDSEKRRVIIDLSFPEGEGVNDGIARNVYEGEELVYTLPTILDMCQEIAKAGRGALMWKCDLVRAYRQLRIDPLAYPLLGIQHRGSFFIDICPSFGCRVSGASQQRVSEAVAHIMRTKGHKILVYVDDFAGIHHDRVGAQKAFDDFNALCEEVGLQLAADKSALPSTRMEWLGFEFDTNQLTVKIPEKKLLEVVAETQKWGTKKYATKREIQSLVGRLAHISTCVSHARKYMTRILFLLQGGTSGTKIFIGAEARKDMVHALRSEIELQTNDTPDTTGI